MILFPHDRVTVALASKVPSVELDLFRAVPSLVWLTGLYAPSSTYLP